MLKKKKILALVIVTVTILFFSLLISYVLGILFFGWGDSMQIDNTIYSGINGVFITAGLYAGSIFPLLAFSTVIIFIALKTTSSGAVVGVSIGIIFALNILSQLAEEIRPFLISTYFNPIVFCISSGGVNILLGVIIILIYGVVSYMLGLKLFMEKDLLY